MLVGVRQVGRQRGLAGRRAAVRGQPDVEVPVGENGEAGIEAADPLEQRPPDHHRDGAPIRSCRAAPAPVPAGAPGQRPGAARAADRSSPGPCRRSRPPRRRSRRAGRGASSGPRSRRRRGRRPTLPAPRRCRGCGRWRRRSGSRCEGARTRSSVSAASRSGVSSVEPSSTTTTSSVDVLLTRGPTRARGTAAPSGFSSGSRPKPGLGADPRPHRSVTVSQGSRFPVARSILAVHPSIGRAAAVWSIHNAQV